MTLNRRAFLGAACSLAASPLATPVVFANTPGENRLVVIVLRGALDGLGFVVPHGDPYLRVLRPTLAPEFTDLDGFYGLAQPFDPLMDMWRSGELGFVHAVSTPYRGKRSHFDGQDILETGGSKPLTASRVRDGWLNRALALIPGAETETAIAVDHGRMLILDGDQPAGSWSPYSEGVLGETGTGLIERMFQGDPLFSDAFAEAMMLGGEGKSNADIRGRSARLAAYAAERLRGPARIAAFSVGGWDTHRSQEHVIKRPAEELVTALTTLKRELAPVWDRTAVVAMTEFGRTVRQNGSGGTDHGTGGAMLLAGGAVRGGQVYGEWPGLGEGRLYADRDLMPTDDVRRWAAWALAAQFGLERSDLESRVFPGLDIGANPNVVG